MNRVRGVFRKGKALFLCAFVAAQIFIPQATVEAATCKHNYQSTHVSTVKRWEYDHAFKYNGGTAYCHEIVYLHDYLFKCTKCGSVNGAYSKETKWHSNPACPDRE